MDIKLDIYKDRFCRQLDRTVVAPDFSLSLEVCEDVLNAINIDVLSGAEALSDEGKQELFTNLIRNGLPLFKDLLKELYGLTDEEIGKTKLEDITKAIFDILKYAMAQLGKSFKSKN